MARYLHLILFLSIWGISPAGQSLTRIDGRELRIPKSPQRVVSLSPVITDLIVALQAKDRLVGITRFSAFEDPSVPIIGDILHWNAEKILSLRPDLLLTLASGSMKKPALFLEEQLNVRVGSIQIESFQELRSAIRELGSLLDRIPESLKIIQELEPATRHSNFLARKRALLLIGTSPLYASTSRTYEGDLLAQAGYENVLGNSTLARRPKLSPEQIYALNPDIVFMTRHGTLQNVELPESLSNLKAIREKRVHVVSSDPLLKPGIHATQGIHELMRFAAE